MMRLLLVVAALASANGDTEQSRLDEARAQWASQGLADYAFDVQRSCFCGREYTREYQMYVREGKPYEPVRYVKEYASVPRLFAVVQEAIDGDGTFEVEYGPTGAPRRISLDPIPEAIDDEYAITVSALREDTSRDVPDVSIRDRSAGSELRAAKARWAERALKDYRYRVRYSCFCSDTDPFTVEVRGGKAVGDGPSVLDLFASVRKAIRAGAVDLRVRYTKSGRPRSIHVDESLMIADEEYGVTTRRPRPL